MMGNYMILLAFPFVSEKVLLGDLYLPLICGLIILWGQILGLNGR
jgi:hypothetical protein